jgi:HK97 family phage major capsid protein
LNPFRDLARVETITEGTWKGATVADVSLSYSAEATEASDNSPAMLQPSITAQRVVGLIPFSIEIGQDWPSLVAELSGKLADGKDILDAGKFLSGSGTNEPTGFFGGATNSLTTTQRIQTNTVATYAVGDPYLLKAAIPGRFYARSTFVANPGTWDTTYRFVGGNSTEPFQMTDRGGPFLGLPKRELTTMATGSTTGTKLILVGDFSQFLIADRLGMSVELIPQLFGATNRYPTGQRGLVAYWRTGSGVLAQNAFRYLEVK